MSDHYFDLHVTGIGYLNRAREVQGARGEPFLAVEVSALHGAMDDVQRTRFDCRVSGAKAKTTLRRLMPDIEQEKPVLVGFKLADLYVETFTYAHGEREGETGVALKARLLKIAWAKVNGEPVALGDPESAAGKASHGQKETAAQPDPDAELFGALWPLRAQVKLDPTVDRRRFRRQRDRLRALGYGFDRATAIWTAPAGG
jgi:hypothetical protein